MGRQSSARAFVLTPRADPVPHYPHGRHVWTVELPSGQLNVEQRQMVMNTINDYYATQFSIELEHRRRLTEFEFANLARLTTASASEDLIRLFDVNAQTYYPSGRRSNHPYQNLPWEMLSIDWVVRKGPITGTFPKRLNTWLNGRLPKYLNVAPKPCCSSLSCQATCGDYRERQFRYQQRFIPKFPASFFAELGATLGPLVNASQKYHLEFRDTIDWKAGEFGDKGSCYWSSYGHAKTSLAASGRSFVLCAYRDPESLQPLGRCWGLRLSKRDNPSSGYLLCNGYGLPLITFARLLGGLLGLNYQLTQVVNLQRAEWPADAKPPRQPAYPPVSTLFFNRINQHEFGGYYLGTAEQCEIVKGFERVGQKLGVRVAWVPNPGNCSCGVCAVIAARCPNCGAWDPKTCGVCHRAQCCNPCSCCVRCFRTPCICCPRCRTSPCTYCCPSCERHQAECICPPCPVCREHGFRCARGLSRVAMVPVHTRTRWSGTENARVQLIRYHDSYCPMRRTTLEQRIRFRELMATPTGKFARSRHARIWTSIVEGMYQRGVLERPALTERDEEPND